MAITSVGYGGTIDEVQWARSAPTFGSDYSVGGAGDWKVSPVSAADRTVSIAAGSGSGHGVRDASDAPASLQGAVVASGSRWDLVVARRSWQPPNGVTQFALVQGTSTKAIPAGRYTNPGVQDDQPLALVRFTAGQQMPTEVVDLRCWAGNGGLVAASTDALAYLGARVGSVAHVGGVQWVRALNAQGSPVWVRPSVSADDITEGFLTRTVQNEGNLNRMGRLTLTNPGEYGGAPNVYMSSSGLLGRTTHRREEATGESLVSFSTRNTFTRRIPFPAGRFAGRPFVHLNIDSGVGATAQWHARAFDIDKDGFTMFLFSGYPRSDGAAGSLESAWSSVRVQWHAVRDA